MNPGAFQVLGPQLGHPSTAEPGKLCGLLRMKDNFRLRIVGKCYVWGRLAEDLTSRNSAERTGQPRKARRVGRAAPGPAASRTPAPGKPGREKQTRSLLAEDQAGPANSPPQHHQPLISSIPPSLSLKAPEIDGGQGLRDAGPSR